MTITAPAPVASPIPAPIPAPMPPFPGPLPLPSHLPRGTWTPRAREVLEARYLWKDEQGQVIEDPDQMCWRVASYIALAERRYCDCKMYDGGRIYCQCDKRYAEEYYRLISSRRFMPNSPALANAGKNNLAFSACYVLNPEDSLPSIFETLKSMALIHQSGGGTGFGFSLIRPQGARVGSNHGVASGPVSFLQIFDIATEQIKQGGMRRGANMAVLSVEHPDILEFIRCKDTGLIQNFNISVGITDRFLQALEAHADYPLVDPHTGDVVDMYAACSVWDEIVDAAWRHGDPGLVFLDRANAGPANPVPSLGPILATNPCGEQYLYDNDVCNLGSLNLGEYVDEKGQFDTLSFLHDIPLAVRFLDSVIDQNHYPLPEIAERAQSLRRIGLGVMGLADALMKMGIPYGSEEAIAWSSEIARVLQSASHDASFFLAKERGPFPLYESSIHFPRGRRIRNAAITTAVPTGTVSVIADCSSGIEPAFSLAYHQSTGQFQFDVVNSTFQTLLEQQYGDQNAASIIRDVARRTDHPGSASDLLRDPEAEAVFQTAGEIAPEWHVRMQAAFQAAFDNGISKSINLPNSATRADVDAAYRLSYELGCLGVTVFRDGCRGEGEGKQVLLAGHRGSEEEQTAADGLCPLCSAPLIHSSGCMECPTGHWSACSV